MKQATTHFTQAPGDGLHRGRHRRRGRHADDSRSRGPVTDSAGARRGGGGVVRSVAPGRGHSEHLELGVGPARVADDLHGGFGPWGRLRLRGCLWELATVGLRHFRHGSIRGLVLVLWRGCLRRTLRTARHTLISQTATALPQTHVPFAHLPHPRTLLPALLPFMAVPCLLRFILVLCFLQ